MTRINFCLLSFLVFFTSYNLSAQTYSTGRETKKADINFTELADFYAAHPLPISRKLQQLEDENEEMPHRSHRKPDPSKVHLIDRSGSTGRVSATTAAMAMSPAPNDTFQATVTDGSNIPPDTHGAVDTQYCITAVNTSFHIQNRIGGNVYSVAIDAFWSSILPSGDDGYDPRIHYDPYYNRWIYITDAVNLTTQQDSYLLIAVSETNNPRGTWHMYSVSIDATNATWLDFPCVGFNHKWITVSGNIFTTAGRSRGAALYVFDYASIMAGTGAPYTKITESGSFTLCPTLTYDTTQSSMFCLEISNESTGSLQLWKISGPVGSPTIASVGYPSTTTHWQNGQSADFAPQLGTTDLVQADDDRITNVTYRNQHLWCAHTIFLPATGTATRSSVMWWEMDTLGNPVQNGIVDDPATPTFFDFPSISVNANNDALLGFGYLSANIHPSAAYTLHLHTDPADSMRHPFVFRHGQGTYYQTFGGTQNRWGDFSATCVDPKNNLDFWTIQESVPKVSLPTVQPNYWDTWWANVTTCPVTASFTVTKSIINKNLNDTINFTGSDPTGTIFTWNYGGGTVVSGTGAGPIVLKWPTYGWKVVTLKDSLDGCSETFVDSILVENKAAVSAVTSGEETASIVPNPSNGTFDIVLGTVVTGIIKVTLYDEKGEAVYEQQWNASNDNRFPVTTDKLPTGLYIANIDLGGGRITTQKITIRR